MSFVQITLKIDRKEDLFIALRKIQAQVQRNRGIHLFAGDNVTINFGNAQDS